MCFPVPAAGFFAKSQIMFFLPSSFRICPSLKNDSRGELRFDVALNDFLAKKKRIQTVSRPRLSGKVSTDRLTEGARVSRNGRIKISVSKTNKNDSVLCTQTCPYRLAKLGTSLRVRGKLTLRKKAIKFYKCINCQVSTQRTEQEMQAVPACRGKWRRQPSEGARVSRYEKRFLTKRY